MEIGNWKIDDNGIQWAGSSFDRFVIPNNELLRTMQPALGQPVMYKWILLATEEEWLTEDDLYDLNFAFVYAVARVGLNFDYAIFDRTLTYQYEQLDEEEREQPD